MTDNDTMETLLLGIDALLEEMKALRETISANTIAMQVVARRK